MFIKEAGSSPAPPTTLPIVDGACSSAGVWSTSMRPSAFMILPFSSAEKKT